MVILAVLAALFLIFYFVRHHTGPAHLAMIAGLSVYEMFGKQFAEFISKNIPQISIEYAEAGILIALILVFPLLLYLHSSRGGLFGILRIAEAGIFAALLTSLLAPTIASYVPFDTIGTEITNFLSSIEGPIVLIGVLSAYLDILLYHE